VALVRTEILIAAAPADVWRVIGDFEAGPQRMAPGFVVGCDAESDVRVVTFADGVVVHERFVERNDDELRLVYSVIGGSVRPDHDTASMQVVPTDDGACRLVWVHDIRPDELAQAFLARMEQGAEVVKRTLDAGTA
jgi:Polyketide cyclase / dehydrase and lipid transport